MIGNNTIDEIVGCKPDVGSVPFFDGKCWTYTDMSRAQTCADILVCVTDLSVRLTSTTIDILVNDITISPTALVDAEYISSLFGYVLRIGSTFQTDLSWILNTGFFLTDGASNCEIKNQGTLYFAGIDGIRILISGSDISVGLPIPVAQYYTPGRCFAATTAFFSDTVAGMVTDVTISADTVGSVGNITLTCDGTSTVAELVDARNIANPGNTITIISGDDTQVPLNGEFIILAGGMDAISCLGGDYQPFNKWLVLTRDCVTKQAQWMPPQCCLQQLSFQGGNIRIEIDIPGQPLPSINTDNQQLSLTIDPGVEELLCLTRRHGGTLGVQIPDPDSCVDLIDINEHTFDLQDNLLYIKGSDGLVNDVVDLSQANEKTIEIDGGDVNQLNLIDSLGATISTADLSESANKILTLIDHLLCIQKANTTCIPAPGVNCGDGVPERDCDPCKSSSCADLSGVKYGCGNILGCMCNVPIDRSALGVVPNVVKDACTYDDDERTSRQYMYDTRDIAVAYTTSDRVMRTVLGVEGLYEANMDTVAGDEPGVSIKRTFVNATHFPALPAGVVPCADWGQWDIRDISGTTEYHRNSRVIHDDGAIDPITLLPYGPRRRAALVTDTGTEPGSDPLVRREISNSLRPNNMRADFFSEDRTITELLNFLRAAVGGVAQNPCGGSVFTGGGCGCTNGEDGDDGTGRDGTNGAKGDPGPQGLPGANGLNGLNGTDGRDGKDAGNLVPVITRQKYRARISLKDNRVGWSKHAYLSTDPNTALDARWLIPTFDTGKGRESSTTKMVDPNGWHIEHDHTTLKIMNGGSLEYSLAIGTGYDVAPSANNPYTQTYSEFAQGCPADPTKCSFCIYIPKDGHYNIEMTGVSQADHNVHAFRMSVLAYRPREVAARKLQILMDSKFGGGGAGSASLNNPLVPTTNQYQMNAMKILHLVKGDILFVGMKIDPRTIWPKYQAETVSGETARDIIYNLNDESPAFGIYTPPTHALDSHTAGAYGGSFTQGTFVPGSLARQYTIAQGGWNVAINEIGRGPANLPNVSPHFFEPTHTGTQHSGAENYGLNLVYPGGGALYDEYRRDDGVVILYGPSSWSNSDGSGSTFLSYQDGGATLSVQWVNSLQNDDISNVEF